MLDSGTQFELSESIDSYTGTLEIKNKATTSLTTAGSGTIGFNNGVLKTGTSQTILSGSLDPASDDTITLNNGDHMIVESGTVDQSIAVAASSTATISGSPRFSSGITLGAASVLELSVDTTINQGFSGGIFSEITLLRNLIVLGGLSHPDRYNLNGFNLAFLSGVLNSSTLDIQDSGTLSLLGDVSLGAGLEFSSGSNVYINGNGFSLDFAGSPIEANNKELIFSDVQFKNIAGTFFVSTGSGSLTFENCTLELSANSSFALPVKIAGDNCKVITNGYTFTMSGSGNDLDVDGVILFYEQLDGSGTSPFQTASSANINLTNGGAIRDFAAGSGGGESSVTIDSDATASYTATTNINLTNDVNLTFDNPDNATAETITFDGGGHFISFPQGDSSLQPFIVDENITVTMADVVLRDFDPAKIEYQQVGADPDGTLIFGDDVYIELGKDLTIASADKAWTCQGNVTIDGHGHTLRVEKSSGITIGSSSLAPRTLTLKNVRLETSVNDCIRCDSSNDHIKLDNMDFVIEDAGYLLNQGNLEVQGFVGLRGRAQTGEPPKATFELDNDASETVSLLIKAGATLFVDHFIELRQDTDASYKHRIFFEESSSELFLNGCTLDAGAEGMVLHGGTLVVQDTVSVESVASKPIEIYDTMNVYILSNGTFDVQGPLEYKQKEQADFGHTVRFRHMNTGKYLVADTTAFAPAYANAPAGDAVFLYDSTTLSSYTTGTPTTSFTFNGAGTIEGADSSDIIPSGGTDELLIGGDSASVPVVTENTNPNYAGISAVATGTGAPHLFTKVAQPSGTPAIHYGDLVTIFEDTADAYLASDGYAYTHDSVATTIEVYGYDDGASGVPGRQAHYWFMEKV